MKISVLFAGEGSISRRDGSVGSDLLKDEIVSEQLTRYFNSRSEII